MPFLGLVLAFLRFEIAWFLIDLCPLLHFCNHFVTSCYIEPNGVVNVLRCAEMTILYIVQLSVTAHHMTGCSHKWRLLIVVIGIDCSQRLTGQPLHCLPVWIEWSVFQYRHTRVGSCRWLNERKERKANRFGLIVPVSIGCSGRWLEEGVFEFLLSSISLYQAQVHWYIWVERHLLS